MKILERQAAREREGLQNSELNRDIVWNLLRYLETKAVFDILANVPFLVYVPIFGFSFTESEFEDMNEDLIFRLVMSLRLLRLVHMYDTADQLRVIMNKLGEIFYMQNYMFKNILSWTLASTKFLLSVHYMACGWIALHNFSGHDGSFSFSEESIVLVYVESWYLMTSTISTVGFGDIKAFNVDTELYQYQGIAMIYMILCMVLGIMLFTTVTSEIFNYQELKTVEEILNEKVNEMETYMFGISMNLKGQDLD